MSDVKLSVEPRTLFGSGPSGRYRREGKVPATVYGLDSDPQSVLCNARELERILHGASGANTLITLNLGDGDALALARQIQRHATRGDLVHVDFVRISRTIAVTAEIPLHLEGEAPGSRQGGLLEQLLFSVTVEAMPGNIPNELVIDVSTLELGDQIHVSDLKVAAGVEIQQEADALVAQVAIPRGLGDEEEGEGEEGEGGDAATASAEGGDSGSDEK